VRLRLAESAGDGKLSLPTGTEDSINPSFSKRARVQEGMSTAPALESTAQASSACRKYIDFGDFEGADEAHRDAILARVGGDGGQIVSLTKAVYRLWLLRDCSTEKISP
jgi:hypothetical protein